MSEHLFKIALEAISWNMDNIKSWKRSNLYVYPFYRRTENYSLKIAAKPLDYAVTIYLSEEEISFTAYGSTIKQALLSLIYHIREEIMEHCE